MQKIESPITKGNTRKVGEIPVHRVLKNIKKQYGIDASDLFKGIHSISIMRCDDTGLKFYYPEIAADESFYNKIGQGSDYYPAMRWEYPEALKYIHKDDNILEIGSGYGAFLDLLKSENILRVQGIELNRQAIDIVRKKGHTIHETLIQQFSQIHSEEFDVVCLFQVLEHITDVESFLNDTVKALKKGGKLIIAVPNDDAFVTSHDYLMGAGNVPPHHVGLWTKEALHNIPKYFPLKLVKIEEQSLPLNLRGYYYSLKVKKIFGTLSAIIIPATRWFAKIVLKNKAPHILGPSIMAVFEKQ